MVVRQRQRRSEMSVVYEADLDFVVLMMMMMAVVAVVEVAWLCGDSVVVVVAVVAVDC